eukprot:2392422-Pyramimonas_sp.AAC.1
MNGSWNAVQHLRKPKKTQHATIQGPNGTPADTEERADVIADYFENEHWEYKFGDTRPEQNTPLGNALPVD